MRICLASLSHDTTTVVAGTKREVRAEEDKLKLNVSLLKHPSLRMSNQTLNLIILICCHKLLSLKMQNNNLIYYSKILVFTNVLMKKKVTMYILVEKNMI